MARSDRRNESNLSRWAEVNENKAASLAENNAERKSMPISAAGTINQASELIPLDSGKGNSKLLHFISGDQ
jgi:hypothetical protein